MRTLLHVVAALAMVAVAPAPFAGNAARAQTAAQPQLATERLVIRTARGSYEFEVEVADDPGEQAAGLMFRETMAPRSGMLFDFGQTRMVTMWMRNTPLSLDMVFIRPDGTVARIAERTEPFSEAIVSSGEAVAYVLEINAGIANLIGLKPGDRVESPSIGG